MAGTSAAEIRDAFVRILGRAGHVASDCPDEQWRWSPGPTAPPIAFHAWHLGRWMDYWQDAVAGPGEQIWERDGLAVAWGLEAAGLGFAGTGMLMADDVPPRLASVPREAVLSYVARALELAIERANAFDAEHLARPYEGHRAAEWAAAGASSRSTAGTMLVQLEHAARHLGMIEALIGVQGSRGTATQ